MVTLADLPRSTRSFSYLSGQKDSCPTLQTAKIAPEVTAMRCLDWDRDRFHIESELKNDTTYNSFLILEEKTALLDTSHRRFREQSLEYVTQHIAPLDLHYPIVNHTEPDHSGLIRETLDWAPHAIVIGSKLAIQFLENILHRSFASMVVKSVHHLDLGRGMSWNLRPGSIPALRTTKPASNIEPE